MYSEFESTNSQNILQTIGVSRDSIGQGVTAVTVALLVQVDQTPAEVVFYVENSGGTASFRCILAGNCAQMSHMYASTAIRSKFKQCHFLYP